MPGVLAVGGVANGLGWRPTSALIAPPPDRPSSVTGDELQRRGVAVAPAARQRSRRDRLVWTVFRPGRPSAAKVARPPGRPTSSRILRTPVAGCAAWDEPARPITPARHSRTAGVTGQSVPASRRQNRHPAGCCHTLITAFTASAADSRGGRAGKLWKPKPRKFSGTNRLPGTISGTPAMADPEGPHPYAIT